MPSHTANKLISYFATTRVTTKAIFHTAAPIMSILIYHYNPTHTVMQLVCFSLYLIFYEGVCMLIKHKICIKIVCLQPYNSIYTRVPLTLTIRVLDGVPALCYLSLHDGDFTTGDTN